MFQLTNSVKNKIKKFSLVNPKLESCGLILWKSPYFLVRNLKNESKKPEESFLISNKAINKIPKKYAKVAFWHSHPDGEVDLSEIDKLVSEKMGLPSVVYDIPNDHFIQYEPKGYEVPLLDRPFVLGILDCYELVRDYYGRNLNISLPEFKHEARYISGDWADSKFLDRYNKENYCGFRDFFLKNGFIEVNSLQKNDIILMKLPPLKTPVHCAIFVGDNLLLHHMPADISKKEIYGGKYKRLTCNILRHNKL